MLKKGARVKIFDHIGTIIDFIPARTDDDALAAVVQTDEEIAFENVRGNVVIMQLRYVGAQWGGAKDTDRIVSGILCPNEPRYPDVTSWFKHETCVEIHYGLIYYIL